MARNAVGGDPDPAVDDLASRTHGLTCGAARRPLLGGAGLADDQHGIVVGRVLHDIVAHDLAEGIRLPSAPPQDGLPAPRGRIARRLGARPARPASVSARAGRPGPVPPTRPPAPEVAVPTRAAGPAALIRPAPPARLPVALRPTPHQHPSRNTGWGPLTVVAPRAARGRPRRGRGGPAGTRAGEPTRFSGATGPMGRRRRPSARALALHTSRRLVDPKVRAFMQHLVTALAQGTPEHTASDDPASTEAGTI